MTKELAELLTLNYPIHGKSWCCSEYGLTEGQVRSFVARNGLKLNRNSDFWNSFQKRAAQSKIGKKRPSQSVFAKKMWAEGKFKASPLKDRIGKNCLACNKIFEVIPTNVASMNRKLCSVGCNATYSKGQWNRKEHPKGMLGKHHSTDTRERLSKSHIGKRQTPEAIKKALNTKVKKGYENRRTGVTWKGGRSNDLGNTYFRSSWERNYARFLNYLIDKKEIVRWEFEPDVFWFGKIKRGCVSYKPDFKVFNTDGSFEYHEVKGWMDGKSKTKIKRMKIYYPKVKLIVIDSQVYRSFAKYGKVFSEFWE